MNSLALIKVLKNQRPYFKSEHVSNKAALSLARDGVEFAKEAEIFLWRALISELKDEELLMRLINNGGLFEYITKLESAISNHAAK